MPAAVSTELPAWARVSAARAQHIARVTSLLREWASAMSLPPDEAAAWRDAGLWHDALRDAAESELRAITGDAMTAAALLHGPAAAVLLARDGERRSPILEAVAHHTVGHPAWERTGRALYMADYLDPGRSFARTERAYLANQVPHDFAGTFREVVRHRIEWALREGVVLHPLTVDLWNSIQ